MFADDTQFYIIISNVEDTILALNSLVCDKTMDGKDKIKIK